MIKLIIFDKDGTLIDHDKLFIPWLNELIKNLEPLLPKNHKLNEHIGFINNKFLLTVKDNKTPNNEGIFSSSGAAEILTPFSESFSIRFGSLGA